MAEVMTRLLSCLGTYTGAVEVQLCRAMYYELDQALFSWAVTF